MMERLPELAYKGIALSVDNSCQYGPICIDKAHRGTGLLSDRFLFCARQMAGKYKVMATFVNQINQRSVAAHRRKQSMDLVQEFEYNNNHYYELAYDVSE